MLPRLLERAALLGLVVSVSGQACVDVAVVVDGAEQPWSDSYADGCDAYSGYDLCTADGIAGPGWDASWGAITDYANHGFTAIAACCACGGGAQPGGGACADDVAWRDLDGENCSLWVNTHQWAPISDSARNLFPPAVPHPMRRSRPPPCRVYLELSRAPAV